MINGIIISRKSDGLIFCEVMDDEDNDKNFWVVRTKAQEFLKNMKGKENLCTVNIDSQTYVLHYKINENVVYLVITHKKYPAKLAFCFLSDIDDGFTEELKNQFGTQSVSYYSKLETIDRANYFLKFEKYIKKKRNEYLDTKSNSNIERLNKEISDVHQIMAENLNLIMDRDRTLNSISSLSEIIKDSSGKFEKTARETRLRMLMAKYAIFIGIGAIFLLIILLVCFIAIIVVASTFFYSRNSSKYGDRLAGIENYPVTSEIKDGFKAALEKNSSVTKVTYDVIGRVIYVNITLDEKIKLEAAQKLVSDSLSVFTEDIMGYYDINFILKSDNFVIIGAKNAKNTEITWNNNRVVEEEETNEKSK